MRIQILLPFIFLSGFCFGQNPNVSKKSAATSLTQSEIESDSLYNKTNKLIVSRQFEVALPLIDSFEIFAINNFGEESFHYAKCKYLRGLYFYVQDILKEVAPYWEEAIQIYRQLEIVDVQYYNMVSNSAALYMRTGPLEDCKAYYLESKDLALKLRGRVSPPYANSLNGLAGYYITIGQPELALVNLNEYLEVLEELHGKLHREYARGLYGLGFINFRINNFEKAEQYFEESINLMIELGFDNTMEIVHNMQALGVIYQERNKYEQAEGIHLKTIKIVQNHFDGPHGLLATAYLGLGNIYDSQGMDDKGIGFTKKGLEMSAELYGKEHPQYLTSLANMGVRLMNKNRYEEALVYFEEFDEKRENKMTGIRREFLQNLTYMGHVYKHRSDYEEAKSKFNMAIQIYHNDPKEESEKPYANALIGLAECYAYTGEYEKAQKNYQEGIDITKRIFGTEAKDYFMKIPVLAKIHRLAGNKEKAYQAYMEYWPIRERQIDRALSYLSGSEMEQFNNEIAFTKSFMLNAALLTEKTELKNLAYDIIVKVKSIALQQGQNTLDFTNETKDSAVMEQYAQLLNIHTAIADEYEMPAEKRQILDSLNTIKHDLERSLVKASDPFRSALESRNTKQKDIRQALNPKTIAIEFVRFENQFDEEKTEFIYAAAILDPNNNETAFIPLFEESELTELLNFEKRNSIRYINSLYKNKLGSSNLYQLIWEPLQAFLNGKETIFISPTGVLNQINLSAIENPSKQLIGEKYKLRILSSTKDILKLDKTTKQEKMSAFVCGDVFYDDPNAQLADTSSLDLPVASSSDFSSNDISLRSSPWKRLQYSREEINKVSSLLNSNQYNTVTYTDTSATEEVFRSITTEKKSFDIIHVASHGFFFPNNDDSKITSNTVFAAAENPLLRSGLILAGGNEKWMGRSSGNSAQDGILTAFEIAQFNLNGTELVVLSACETGLGEIQGDEGVYGLQRAFKIAGVDKILMSLWKVPDQQTQELMVSFYTHYLTHKMTISEAFNKAQNEIRVKYKQAYFWAGFVLLE